MVVSVEELEQIESLRKGSTKKDVSKQIEEVYSKIKSGVKRDLYGRKHLLEKYAMVHGDRNGDFEVFPENTENVATFIYALAEGYVNPTEEGKIKSYVLEMDAGKESGNIDRYVVITTGSSAIILRGDEKMNVERYLRGILKGRKVKRIKTPRDMTDETEKEMYNSNIQALAMAIKRMRNYSEIKINGESY